MNYASRSLRWLQIGLTIFYGQVLGTGIYQYFIQGLTGLIDRQRSLFDSIYLLLLGLTMIVFVGYAVFNLWYPRRTMSVFSCFVLIFIFLVTLLKTIIQMTSSTIDPLEVEWRVIRITELVLRAIAIVGILTFIICMRKGYEPDEF